MSIFLTNLVIAKYAFYLFGNYFTPRKWKSVHKTCIKN